jgi:two-component system, chemotaxis family, CheB/CheR fusion protein
VRRGSIRSNARKPERGERPARRATLRVGSNRGAPPTAAVTTSDRESEPITIVGVGASAGGLDAFSQMLESLKPDGNLAVVFVQHLSPQHESALPALLAAKTKLPVVPVTDHLRVAPNHVYVIPPNVQITLAGGELRVAPRPHDKSQFTPIDVFFQSLAHAAQERAIGVILSGTASDGAAGLREIKAQGGITLVQKPDTAKYDSMPRAAIATGMVDLVLGPREIIEHILDAQKHPYLQPFSDRATTDDAVRATDIQFAEIFAMLRRVSGIDFKQYKLPTLRRRLLRRMALHRTSEVGAYIRHLRNDPQEIKSLCQDLLIHVTRFFREPESFAALANNVFPDILGAHGANDPVRLWIPGCATGEEVYSLGMTLVEFLGDQLSERRIQIFATDVGEGAIEQARAGIYPLSIAADVSPERLKRFFSRSDGGYKINQRLREMCVFARHDLTRDPPFSRIDLIVCRNVLIYLDAAAQNRLISVFHYALNPHGFLMLGHTETIGSEPYFAIADKRWRLYRKVAAEPGLSATVPAHRMPAPRPAVTVHEPIRNAGRPGPDEVSRLLLERYSPAGVVVDGNFQIVQFRGKTGAFLESASGEPSLSILKMAREGLLFVLKTALQTALRKRQTVRKEGVRVRRNGDWQEMNLEVIPLSGAQNDRLLVVFETPGQVTGTRTTAVRPRTIGKRETEERVTSLTRELEASREYLQSTIQELEAANEELQSANEEILSSNEELQSTNEELDTAKEELQSTNEELNTVNEELHSRNEELTRANSDLINLLGSTDITIVIVSNEMRIRRFTPMAESVLNLIPGDVGRPISQIKPNLASVDLEDLIRKTIDTVTPTEHEVQDRTGRWYSLRIRPYRGVDNRFDGAILALIDLDVAKRYQRQIERSRDYFLAIVETLRQPLMVLDHDFRVKSANRMFYETFGLSRRETEGISIFEVGHHQWDLPELRTLLSEVSANQPSNGFAVEHVLQTIGHRRILLNARRLELEEEDHWILLSIEDVSQEGLDPRKVSLTRSADDRNGS